MLKSVFSLIVLGLTFSAFAATNEFPIVTHWNASLNNGAGGFQLGASDYPAALVTTQGGSYNPDFFDTDPNSPYVLNTQAHALYSADKNTPDAKVPGEERYVGENYSIYRIGNDVAEEFSANVKASTGFPAVHLNGDDKCRLNDLAQNVPYFQIVHACPVGMGDQQSLATLIIPPNWSPAQNYPVLLYPYYDIHLTFLTYGETVAKVLGAVVKTGLGSGIGVLWNAGATSGTFGLHASMYSNATQLFQMLNGFGADTQKIVAVGCSRGGAQSLAIAGNPQNSTYKVKEVIAYSPAVAYGTRDSEYLSPTYPAFISALTDLTGYKYAWREGWRELGTGLRSYERVFQNTFSTVDPSAVDALSPIGDAQLNALKAHGTRVNLSIDTQDQFMPIAIYSKYVNKASALGVPMRVRINYRGTHCGNADMLTDSVTALLKVNLGDDSFLPAVEEYGIKKPDDVNRSLVFEQITSTPAIHAELPKYVVPSGTFFYSVSGQPETYYKLEIFKTGQANPILKFEGRLPQAGASDFLKITSESKRMTWPSVTVPGNDYFYMLSHSQDGSTWSQASYVPVIGGEDPKRKAVLQVLTEEPMEAGDAFCPKIQCRKYGWGLSSR